MEQEKIKENINSFEIETDVSIDRNNFDLTVTINDITKELLLDYCAYTDPTDNKRDEVYLTDDTVISRYLINAGLAKECLSNTYSAILFSVDLLTHNTISVPIRDIKEGTLVIDDLKTALMATIMFGSKLKKLKTKIKVEEE